MITVKQLHKSFGKIEVLKGIERGKDRYCRSFRIRKKYIFALYEPVRAAYER